MGGLDGIVFTAGVGENAAPIREAGLPTPAPGWAWSSTPTANAARARRISTPGSRVGVHVIPTDENLMIARHTRALVR